MHNEIKAALIGAVLFCSQLISRAQVYSPKVLAQGQVDTSNLESLAQSIYRNAHASTDREKAEAIWRFYLTDGRFVKPGMFYHIPGWSYEEPMGEVLDPIKLINSYGFGLCYQVAPLLQATWEAGGFKHARVWFLTGHTVAEVFYDGKFHYYDSDMMGYTTVGDGPVKSSRVASVTDIANDRSILLNKLQAPKIVKPGAVDSPWYNADVRADAIGGLADLFSTKNDNYLYGDTRYSHGHTMDFVLRPGERMIRYYSQPDSSNRYLPYKTDGKSWKEFPQDWGSGLLVKDGPKSEKDHRRWSTGLIEYRPNSEALRLAQKGNKAVYSVASPYVIIGAKFSMKVSLGSANEGLAVETSTDGGRTWAAASSVHGPLSGAWEVAPKTIEESAHGALTAVSGTYGYLVRLTLVGSKEEVQSRVSDLLLSTDIEFNPRTLPEIVPGMNVMNYEASDVVRKELPIRASDARAFSSAFSGADYISEAGQGYLRSVGRGTGEIVFKVSSDGTEGLSGVDAGGRFLDLSGGLAPDKLTAEVRKIAPWPADAAAEKSASIAWSSTPRGPWTTVWSFDPKVEFPDGQAVKQVLRWPEVDRNIRDLESKSVYIRYSFKNLALDDIRLASIQRAPSTHSKLTITHRWIEDGKPGEFSEEVNGAEGKSYRFSVPSGSSFQNQALILAAD